MCPSTAILRVTLLQMISDHDHLVISVPSKVIHNTVQVVIVQRVLRVVVVQSVISTAGLLLHIHQSVPVVLLETLSIQHLLNTRLMELLLMLIRMCVYGIGGSTDSVLELLRLLLGSSSRGHKRWLIVGGAAGTRLFVALATVAGQ